MGRRSLGRRGAARLLPPSPITIFRSIRNRSIPVGYALEAAGAGKLLPYEDNHDRLPNCYSGVPYLSMPVSGIQSQSGRLLSSY